MKTSRKFGTMMLALILATHHMIPTCLSCTGITLIARNGDVVYGRTMEWGSFDLNTRIMIVPRNYKFVGTTPDGLNGMRWETKYGIAGLDALERPVLLDAMNEKGLTAGLFYHPGFAEYADYDALDASNSMAPTDVVQFLLGTCENVVEVREAIKQVKVVNVVDESLGFPAPIHLMVSDPSGKQIVIEWKDGKAEVFDAALGVITNAPNYDWHLTNLRNYVNLSPVALPGKDLKELDFTALGGGSGMIGLPGDFTPPSRFIRAVAFSQSARPTGDGPEAVYEAMRILDNFNVPLGASEGSGENALDGMRSSTLWTSVHDLKNRVIYYHTQHNRQVRKVEIGDIDFEASTELRFYPLDEKKQQLIKDRTPRD